MLQLSIYVLQVLANLAIVGTFFIYWFLWKAAIAQLQQMTDQSKASSRQQAWHDFFADFAVINNFISRENEAIAPPYPKLKSGQTNGVLLFHHLNLIFRFHVNKLLLTEEERQGFQHWIEVVFFQWIEKNPSLGEDLKTILDFGDLYPKSFLSWMREHPSYARVLRGGRQA